MSSIKRQSSAPIPTPHGTFTVSAYAQNRDEKMPNLAIVSPNVDVAQPVLCRLHSECITGDIFHSFRCDCGEQLDRALHLAGVENGVVLYLRQEGRGIGIINKLDAYRLQDDGADTVEANEQLHLPADARDYQNAIDILHDLGITKIRLLTNNPLKVNAFVGSGIEVVERVPIVIASRAENANYLATKIDKMGHLREDE